MKCPRQLWNIWFIFLLLLAVGMVILVVKLMNDRKTRMALERESTMFIQSIESMLDAESEKVAEAKWIYMTNQTERSKSNYQYTLYHWDNLVREIKLNMTALPWETFKASKLRRKFHVFLNSPRISLLPPWKTAELNAIKFNITTQQEQSGPKRLQQQQQQDDSLGDKSNWILFNERVGGEGTKALFGNYVKLINENAALNEFPNAVDFWLTSDYEMEAGALRKTIFKLWDQIKPLHQQLHSFVVDQLRSRSHSTHASRHDGLIPAHVFELEGKSDGDWTELYKTMKPFPKKPDLNITAELRKRRYSPQSMAKLSEEFFESNHFPTMKSNFWSESIFHLSPRTLMDCRPTLYKISNNEKQLRISLCGEKDEQTFRTINKLMTRAKFILLRKDQPFLFRYDTDSVIALAAEDAVQMFMESTNRLKNLGLMDDFEEDLPSKINSLFREALNVLPRMAHALAFDQWNSNVFAKLIKPKEYNCNWWAIRQTLEGVEPPSRRKSSQFDPARSSYLVAPPSAPFQTFVVSVLKFQLYKNLKEAAELENIKNGIINDDGGNSSSDEESPDGGRSGSASSGSLEASLEDKSLSLEGKAGEIITSILKTGSSKPWKNVLQEIANETELNAKPLLDYFEPLFKYLKERNKGKGLNVDWESKRHRKAMCSK